jgi:hypothetical protein
MVSSYKENDQAGKKSATAQLVKAAAAKADGVKPSPKVKAAPVASDPASNAEETEVVKVIRVVPELTLTGKDFIAKQRDAGMRLVDGKRIYDPAEVRNDTIKLIESYCGYDPKGNFSSQELMARTKDLREIRQEKEGQTVEAATMPLRADIRRLNATLTGYVHGLPDTRAKALANLEARQKLAVDTIVEQEKLAGSAPTDQEKAVALAMVQVERERLVQIRIDLDALTDNASE